MCFSARWVANLRKHCPSVAHHWDDEGCYGPDSDMSPELMTRLADECPPLRMTFFS
jgi:hypothetical protein